MAASFKVGQAPWEANNTGAAVPSGHFAVGQAPWEAPPIPIAQSPSGIQPTFPAVEGGAGSIPGNIARTIGNIPSSAAKLVVGAVKPIVDLTTSLLPLPGSKDQGAVSEIVGNVGAKEGAKMFGASFKDTLKSIGESIHGGATGFIEKLKANPTQTLQEVANHIAKTGVEDPLLIPSLLYGGEAKAGTKIIEKGTAPIVAQVEKGIAKATPDLITKDAATLKAEKLRAGYEEHNTRLKSVDNSFKKNTKTYTNTATGEKRTVTPIDTLLQHDIAPQVEKGTIRMGDYKTGEGALGQIRTQVGNIDDHIDTVLKDNGTPTSVDLLRERAIAQAKRDPTLKESGKVASTVNRLETIFEDFKQSYGESIPILDLNAIRKRMNADFHEETVDTSRVIGDAAREVVYNTTPDQAVKKLLQQQGELLAAKKYAETMNGTKVVGGRIGNHALRATGAIIGSGMTKLPFGVGPFIGAVGGEYAARALQQAQFRSFGAEAKALLSRKSPSK